MCTCLSWIFIKLSLSGYFTENNHYLINPSQAGCSYIENTRSVFRVPNWFKGLSSILSGFKIECFYTTYSIWRIYIVPKLHVEYENIYQLRDLQTMPAWFQCPKDPSDVQVVVSDPSKLYPLLQLTTAIVPLM